MLRPEQILQLQLDISDSLTVHTTRAGIGLALAEVLNRVEPFEFFLHSIWVPGATTGYRISSFKNPEGKFEVFDDAELENLRETNFEAFVQTGIFLKAPENAGIYQGPSLKELANRFQAFYIGYYHHNIRSMMVLNMTHENGFHHAMLISDRRENAFSQDCFQTVQSLLPQVRMAFENLFKYEALKQEEENKKTQLELNNELLNHTKREDFGLALAQIINKRVPCERFVLRTWTGPVEIGYVLPLTRKEDGTFTRFIETALLEHADQSPEAMIEASDFIAKNPGIYQGEDHLNLRKRFSWFEIGAKAFNVNSDMVLSFNMEDTTCILILGNSAENSFHDSQYRLMQLLMPQIILAFNNLFNYEKLQKQERAMSLQLGVNNALVRHRVREDLCLELNRAINEVVPFEMGFARVWSDPGELGFFRGYAQDDRGEFRIMENNPFVELAREDLQTLKESGERFAEVPRIIQGNDFLKLCEIDRSFKLAYDKLHIRSTLSLHVKHESNIVQFVLTSTRENAFTEDQLESINLLQPQIKLTFENVFNYEHIQQREEEKRLQLEVNNVLLGHTNREDFGIALAEVINKSVPCERFVIRTWTGEANVGYRIPLIRKEDGTFERFSELPMMEHAESNPESMIMGSNFMAERPGIYQGELHKKLREQYPFFALGAKAFQISSAMVFTMKIEDTTCIMILGNQAEVSFNEAQYKLIQTLTPQIILALENLFKYEKLKQEEAEGKVQLGILAAFNAQKDIDEMALDAIAQVNEFIAFDYWINIASVPRGKDLEFRLAYKQERKMIPMVGPELFNKLECPPMSADEFQKANEFLYKTPALFVGEKFEELRQAVPFFEHWHKNFKMNSLITMPVETQGQKNTLIMMGSVRGYAFTKEDLEAMQRTIPCISMAAQQYYSLFHIQMLKQQLEMEKDYLVEEIKSNYNFNEIIGSNHLMKDVFKQISQVASTDSTVLILGETGTGKELIARAIHNQSPRKDKVLVKLNCASLPAQLIESELFGHEKGSFTGALEKRIGKFELANGGTIFLDEMGELPLELQAKLLRVLQEREIERIGGKSTIQLDVRIIAATNRDLETEVAEGRFRSDLFYRLSVFPIQLPPLRERKEDIPMLITHFLQKYSQKMKKPFRNLKDETIQEMIRYEWPGNIRELENVIEQTVIVGDAQFRKTTVKKPSSSGKSKEPVKATTDGSVTDSEIFQVLKLTKGKITGAEGAAAILGMRPAKIEEYERKWILDALQKTAGRIRGENGAAELIGVKPTTLEARVKKLNIGKAEIFK